MEGVGGRGDPGLSSTALASPPSSPVLPVSATPESEEEPVSPSEEEVESLSSDPAAEENIRT